MGVLPESNTKDYRNDHDNDKYLVFPHIRYKERCTYPSRRNPACFFSQRHFDRFRGDFGGKIFFHEESNLSAKSKSAKRGLNIQSLHYVLRYFALSHKGDVIPFKTINRFLIVLLKPLSACNVKPFGKEKKGG